MSPRRDCFVVVPREYRSAGAPPAAWFIDDLMCHLGRRYYVALLSAAALHGAGHQQAMAFQVLTDAVEPDIEVGRDRIEFHVSRRLAGMATQAMQTGTGTMVVATPETTTSDPSRPRLERRSIDVASEAEAALFMAHHLAAHGLVAPADLETFLYALESQLRSLEGDVAPERPLRVMGSSQESLVRPRVAGLGPAGGMAVGRAA